MFAAKLDLLMKKLDDKEKSEALGTVKALDSHMTCEVCGNVVHCSNDCPETREDVMLKNNNSNGFRPQGGQGWNQNRPFYQGGNNSNYNNNKPSLKDLVCGQAKIIDTLS